MRHVVFSDFDGTVTAKDTIDAMYDAFGLTDWPAVAKDLYAQGLRSRQIIKKMLGMLDASHEQIVALLRRLPLRPGFDEFRAFCKREGWELILMSEGISLSVETVLHERGIDDLPYFGNVLERDKDGRWTTSNPHASDECHDCGNCKSAHVIDRKRAGDAVVYIGDGATDRCPAMVSDIVFATGYLATFCARTGIPFVRFDTFHDVVREMSKPDFIARLEAEAARDLPRKRALPDPDRAHAENAEGPKPEANPYDKGQ